MIQAYTAPETPGVVEDVEIQGHIIDSLILPKVLDEILTHGGSYVLFERQRRQPCERSWTPFTITGRCRPRPKTVRSSPRT